jgi:phosphate starvation-inducible PhoH-like protein
LEVTVKLDPECKKVELFGSADSNLRLLRWDLDVDLTARADSIKISGDEENVTTAVEIINKMQDYVRKYSAVSPEKMRDFLTQDLQTLQQKDNTVIDVYSKKQVIEPSTKSQRNYVDTMLSKDITFCTGPAGTGKTYLAVAVAVSMLKKKQVRRIVLARPAVEAGENLGFLPGDLQAKVNPYLRPLFDALEDMMDFAQMKKFIELDIIEIIPLAFMRGRTLNDAFIICDEAQNTSPSQMLMVLTRLGHGSKMVLTGDITQIDIGDGKKNGITDALNTLKDIKQIGVVRLSQKDIVRHQLVQNIVEAYNQATGKKHNKSKDNSGTERGL